MGKKQSNPSEIVLKVRRRIVRADKRVLMKESKYFEALLGGNYSDSNKTEINLTKDVEDMDILQSVVVFMNTDYIFLSDQNIQQIAQLSSFFVIERLQDKCNQYLKKNLVCENWLKYYFIASENALSEVLHYTDAFISSRMHDLLIFEDESLVLRPDQMETLWQKGYLKYCTYESLKLFMAKWLCVSGEVQKDKLTVAMSILEEAQKRKGKVKDEHMTKDLTESVGKLKGLLNVKEKKMENMKKLLNMLEETVSEDMKEKNDGNSEQFAEPEKCDVKTTRGKVQAIFTASERISLKRKRKDADLHETEKFGINSFFDGMSDTSDLDDIDCSFNPHENLKPERMIDLCVYDTQTDIWYHLDKFNEREYMGHFEDYMYDWTKNCIDDIDFEVIATDTHLVVLDVNAGPVGLVFDMRSRVWRKFSCIRELQLDVRDAGESIRTRKFVVGRNNIIYLVLCLQVKEEKRERGHRDENVGSIYFRIYQLDVESLELIEVCQNDNVYDVPDCRDWKTYLRETKCLISETRKEILIRHFEGSGLDIVLKVNLEAEEDEFGKPKLVEGTALYKDPSPKDVLVKVTDGGKDLFEKVELFETRDAYLIHERDGNDNLCMKLKYSFVSEEISEVEKSTKHRLCADEERFMEADKVRFIKAKRVYDSKKSVCQGSSLWQIEQYLRFGSVLQEVKFDNSGKGEVIKHRPPPCSLLIAVSSAIVEQTFFQGLEPVKHYFEKNAEDACG